MLTALDETMGQAVFLATGKLAVSMGATVAWHRPVSVTNDYEIVTKIRLIAANVFWVDAAVRCANNQILASMSGSYFQPRFGQAQAMMKGLEQEAKKWFRN